MCLNSARRGRHPSTCLHPTFWTAIASTHSSNTRRPHEVQRAFSKKSGSVARLPAMKMQAAKPLKGENGATGCKECFMSAQFGSKYQIVNIGPEAKKICKVSEKSQKPE